MAGTRLSGRTVLLTGAGSGLGRSLALAAAERGAHVVLWDASPERVEAVRAEIGGSARAQAVDGSDRSAVAEAARVTGTVGVLVHTVATATGPPLLDATDEAIEQAYAVDALPLYWVTRAFLPAMVSRQGGHVVTVTSAAGLAGGQAGSGAALGFAEALRAEMRAKRTGVRTTVVYPSRLDSGVLAGLRSRLPASLPRPTDGQIASRILHAVESGRQCIASPVIVSGPFASGSDRP